MVPEPGWLLSLLRLAAALPPRNDRTRAAETLASVGLTVSDAVRILLTRITKENGLPAGLVMDPEAHDDNPEAAGRASPALTLRPL
ncbi:type II toxin-antitoxin system RelB/DinJ family antitoxin [Luteimonas sp. MJ174]|uniref:type II toxin-antitoxin system RelB/DinJ family antitoxin n=1 Tax=Luteimonas sp. MJ174 TaxID=3129237 RepID=UPI0031BBC4D6